jgi:hypothetical protein
MLEGWRTNKARFLSSLLRPIPSARSHEVALEGCGNREEALGQRKRTDQTPTAILDPVAPHRARSSRPRIQTVVVCECVPQHKYLNTRLYLSLFSYQYSTHSSVLLPTWRSSWSGLNARTWASLRYSSGLIFVLQRYGRLDSRLSPLYPSVVPT